VFLQGRANMNMEKMKMVLAKKAMLVREERERSKKEKQVDD
jgi:hypothetical protein